MGKASGAPKCRLCGHEHWSTQGHVFDGEAKAARPKLPPVGRPAPAPPIETVPLYPEAEPYKAGDAVTIADKKSKSVSSAKVVLDAMAELARIREMKAAKMRRYRQRKRERGQP